MSPSQLQAVGLLAVLAVSGCVALLCAFGKQKLLSHACGKIEKPPTDMLVELTPEDSPVPTQDPHPAEKKVKPIVLKKVRFALDVIEPAGDGGAYRGKNKKPICKAQEHDGKCRQNIVGVNAGNSFSIKDRKAQMLTKSDLPANRLVLYKGMQQYRSMDTLDCRF